MPRKTAACINCGETREMAAHGLCFTCYRREGRADDRKFAIVDRHNPGIRREHKKLFRGFTSLMIGLSDLGVSSGDVITIRGIIEPYLTPISKFLTPAPARDEADGEVNGEQQPETCSPFTQSPVRRQLGGLEKALARRVGAATTGLSQTREDWIGKSREPRKSL